MKRTIRGLTLCFALLSAGAGLCADRYVATGGTDSGDGGIDAPWATVTHAVANSAAGDVIHVGAGTFSVSAALTVAKDITLLGKGEDATTINIGSVSMTVNSANAVVSGFKLTKSATNNNKYNLTSGTITNCLLTGCKPSSSTIYTTLSMTGGLLVDCRITNNTAGNGNGGSAGYFGAVVFLSGNATVRNCYFSGNNLPYGGCAYDFCGAGAIHVSPDSGKTVTIEDTTVAGNTGCVSGGIVVGSPYGSCAGAVVLRRCVIAGNKTSYDYADCGVAATHSRDLSVYLGKTGTLTIENTHFGTAPTPLSAIATVSGVTTGGTGFVDERAADYTLQAGSPAFGLGYDASVRPAGFSCAVKTPATDRAIASLPLTLEALTFNAPSGTASYEWDFDGDGTYDETTAVPTVEHTFETPGWNKVGLKVTVGDDSAPAPAQNLVYVAPSVIYLAPFKKNAQGNAVFPYATLYNAATTPADALSAALPGSRIEMAAGEVSGVAKFCDVTLVGAGKTSSTLKGSNYYLYNKATLVDVKLATSSGNNGSGVQSSYDSAVMRNCWIYGFKHTTASTPGGTYSAGTYDGCLFTGCYCNGGSGVFSFSGSARARNCVFTGNYFGGSALDHYGIVYVSGNAQFENNVVYGNHAVAVTTAGKVSKSAGIYVSGGSPTIRNCVVRGNKKDGTLSTGTEANWCLAAAATPTIENCNTPDLPDGVGTGIQTADPKFDSLDISKAPEARDFHIADDSPCVDAGAFVSFATAKSGTDYYGNSRIQGFKADVGAHEVTKATPTLAVTSSAEIYFDEQDVVFTAAGTNPEAPFPAETVYSWTVNGVAQTETGASLTVHVEPIATYTVTATVNGYFSDTKTIQVKYKPGVEFTSEATAKAGHALVNLSAYGVGGFVFDSAAVFKWYRGLHGEELGAEPFATGKDIENVRFEVGTWDVKVVVENADGQGMQLEKLHEEELTVESADVDATFSATEGEQTQSVTMTAVPTGFAFDSAATFAWYWTNDGTGAADATTNPATHNFTPGTWSVVLKVTNADGDGASFTKTYPNVIVIQPGVDWYVSPTGNDSQAGTHEAPFKSLAAALAVAQSGQEIRVMAGTNFVSGAVDIPAGVTVRGEGRDKSVLDGNYGTYRGPRLVNDGATLADLTVQRFRIYNASYQSGGGLYMTANCVVTNCRITANNPTQGGSKGAGIFLSKGKVVNCVIDNNVLNVKTYTSSEPNNGAGIRMTGGLVEGCLIANNRAPYADNTTNPYGQPVYAYGGGVSLEGGTLRNCTIVGNSTFGFGGNVYRSAGTIENCIIADGSAEFGDSGFADDLYPASATNYVSNTVIGGGETDHVYYFGSAGLGANYALTDNATGVGAGDATLAFAASVDINGNPRIHNGRVDLGCFARTSDEVAVGITADRRMAKVGTAVTLKAELHNTAEAATAYAWTVTKPSSAVVDLVGAAPTLTLDEVGTYNVAVSATVGGNPVAGTRNGWLVAAPASLDVTTGGDIHAAVAQLTDGCTLNVSGTISITKPVSLKQGITVLGEGSALTTVKNTKTGSGFWRVFDINHPDAVVKGLKITGGHLNAWYPSGAGARIGHWGGRVTECLITGNNAGGSSYGSGGGLTMYGAKALVDHCVITNNGVKSDAGGGVLLRGGTLENCLIARNWMDGTYGDRPGAGVYLCSTTAKIKNCTIAGNTGITTKGTGLFFATQPAAGQVVNTLVAENTTVSPAAYGGSDWSMDKTTDDWKASAAAAFVNCGFEGIDATGAGSVTTETSPFVDAANKNYALLADAAMVDAGKNDLTLAAAKDVTGAARLQGLRVDIGAYEVTKATPELSVTSSAEIYFDEQDVVFTAANAGAPFPAGTVYSWTVNGEAQAETGASLTLHVEPPATYTVQVTVLDGFQAEKTIQVKHSPGIEFETEVAAMKAGHWYIDFTTEPVGGITFDTGATFAWYRCLHGQAMGAEPFATVQDPKHQRFDVGTWDVKVVVSNWDGKGGTLERLHEEVGTVEAADVAVTFSATEGEQMLPVTMTAAATGFAFDAAAQYAWYWTNDGSGTADATTNPANHTFEPGTYTVVFKVTNADGDDATFTKTFPNAIKVAQGANWYVSPTGDDTKGGSVLAPFASVEYALSRATDGQEIRLMAGTHTLTNALALSRNVKVVGAGADQTTVIVSEGKAISVSHADAVFAGCTVNKAVSGNYVAVSLSAGTVRGCDLTKCSPSSTVAGCVLTMTGGLFEDCRVFGNSITVGCALCEVVGNSTVRNCAFFGNSGTIAPGAPNDKNSGAAGLRVYPGTDQTVRIENCTIADNVSGWTGGLLVSSHINSNYPNNLGQDVAGTVIVENSVFCGNSTFEDVDAASSGKLSDDIGVYAAAGHVSFSNCHIGVKPSGLDQAFAFTDCTDGYDLTFADEDNGDYSLPTGSPRYGIGYHAGTRGPGFTAAVQAVTARANRVPFTTTLNALMFNAPAGTASYAWDLDGDGEYETATDVPTVEHTFTTVGNNTVGLKVTVGDAVAVAPVETVAYVLPTVYVKATGSGTYPYDTEEKAAKTFDVAKTAIRKGSRVHVKGNATINGSAALHDVELFGDGMTSSALVGGANSAWCFQYGKNTFVHSLKMSDSRNQGGNQTLLADTAVVSNCWVSGMWFTTSGSPAGYISKGLVTHSKFTGCHCNYGPVISIYGTATVRNCVFTGNRLDEGVAQKRTGVIHVYGNAVFENNTVWGNYAKKTASNEVHTAGLYIPSGSPTIRNNIVRYNWIKGTPGSAGAEKQNYLCLSAATPTVTHNNSDEGFGENATTGDPIFTNAANGDFSISTEGAAFEKGCAYPALKAAGATDFAGNARVQGWAVDQGAYEATTVTPNLDFTADVTSGVGAKSVTLTLTSDIAMPAGTVVTWFWNGAEVAEKGASITLDLNPGHHSFAVDVNGFFEVTKQDFVNLDPATVFVIAGNAGAAYPYDTRETAAATLDVAVSAAAASGTTIYLAEGEHTLAADLTVAKNVTIVGEGPGAKVTGAGALTLNAGLLQRVDFCNAGMLTVGSGATVRNAIVRNSTAATAVAVLAGGALENATVWGNTGVGVSNAGTAANVVAWSNGTNLAGAGTFNHCLGNQDPLFADPANGDFTFIFDSPCYNAGDNLAWAVADDAIDFYGHKRKLGPQVDIGAHEEENYVESVDFETEEEQMNGYKRVTFVAKARGFHFAPTAEFQWFWTTPGTGTPDATGNNAVADFDTGTYDVYLKVLKADAAGNDFATNHVGAVVVPATGLSFTLSSNMGGGSKTIALTAVPSGFAFTDQTVYKWFWTTPAKDTPDATVNPAVNTFTTGTYGVKLVVENANGHGLAFTNEVADAIKIYDNTPPEVQTGGGGSRLYVDQLEAKKFKTVNGQALTGHGTLDIVSADTYRAVEDVSDYGATGDGVTDDTAAIMAAYNAAVASGKPLYFPKRGDNATYLTRKGIVMRSGMTLTSDPGVTLASASAVLEGGGRTIRTTLAAEMPKGQQWCMVKSTAGLVVGQEVTIGDGNSYTETLADITAIDAETGRIDFDVSRFVASGTNEGALNKTAAGSYFLTDFSLVKTCMTIPAVNVLVENITLKPYGNPSDPYIYTISPIHQTKQASSQQYFRVRNVTIDGATHDGISLQGSGDSIVENCVVKDVKRKGIHWGTTCNRVIVRNNLCINCGKEEDDPTTSNWGVGAMYFCVCNHQMILEGNHFKNCYRGVFGFDFRGSGESDGDSTVANNTFEDCTYGVFTYGGYRLNVVGNTFTGLKGKAMAVSVNKDNTDGLLSSVIAGNTVGGIADTWTGKAFGIDCCTGLVLEGNVVTKNPNATGFAGVWFKNAKKSVVADNVLPDGVDDTDATNTGIIKSGNIIEEEVQ